MRKKQRGLALREAIINLGEGHACAERNIHAQLSIASFIIVATVFN